MFPLDNNNHDDSLMSSLYGTMQFRIYQKPISFEDKFNNLKAEIDKCLDNGDKEKFAILSKQFNLMRVEA